VRGTSVIRQNPADFARNTFELRPIHTAEISVWVERTETELNRTDLFNYMDCVRYK
jgi:hypothetical protein